MDKTYLHVIEALIFASDEPIVETEIIRAIKGIDGEDIEITSSDVNTAVENLNNYYESNNYNDFVILRLTDG